ncbi:MAG: hypothetical protein U0787_18735 [Polyangia bacterium]
MMGVPFVMFVIVRHVQHAVPVLDSHALVPKPFLSEWFLNTPSHHRVHHGINPRYIDKTTLF